MISVARRTTDRVTKWKDGTKKKRWISAGMPKADRSFRRVSGYKGMAKVVDAVARRHRLFSHPKREIRQRRLGGQCYRII